MRSFKSFKREEAKEAAYWGDGLRSKTMMRRRWKMASGVVASLLAALLVTSFAAAELQAVTLKVEGWVCTG